MHSDEKLAHVIVVSCECIIASYHVVSSQLLIPSSSSVRHKKARSSWDQ